MKQLSLFALVLIPCSLLLGNNGESQASQEPECSTESPKTFSFRKCQQETLRTSERLSIAELQILIEEEKVAEFRGINLPKIFADITYNHRDTEPGAIIDNPMKKIPPLPPNPQDPNPPTPKKIPDKIRTIGGEKNTTCSKISLIVPLYDFGRVDNLVRAQHANVTASEYDRDRIQQDLLFAVAVTYLRALEGKKIEHVVQESIKVLENQLQTTRELYSVGLITKNEVLVIEVQLAERFQELIQAQHNIELSLASLNRLTWLNIENVSQLDDVSQDVAFDLNLQNIIQEADQYHPTLKKIIYSTQAASYVYDSIMSENLPKISSYANGNSSTDKFLAHKHWANAGITIQIPIVEGGITLSKLYQQKKRISELDLQYKEVEYNIHLEIKRAFLQVDSAFKQIPVAQKSILLAEENLTISREKFDEGLITSDDVMNDEQRLAQARSNYYQALYNFYIANSELEFVAGIIKINTEKGVSV